MSTLKEEYKKFLEDIENNIKNKEDLEYIKERFTNFTNTVIEQMEYVVDNKEEKMNQLEEKQKQLDEKIAKIQDIVNHIEKDIYSEDGFDFEIVCPYCNYEFIIDMEENKTEIQCPECENIIELDWSGDINDDDGNTGCNGECSHCHGCDEDDQEDDDM